MRYKFCESSIATVFTLCLLSVSQTTVQAGPGNLGQTPLFVAPPVPPNIFFMLDDSGSMHWTMPSDGVGSQAITYLGYYHTRPDITIYTGQDPIKEWNAWCLGANLMAYNPNFNYEPWAADQIGTNTPFPDQTDLANVWVNPVTKGVGSVIYESGENSYVQGFESGTIDLSGAPIVTWTDTDLDGDYDAGECPSSYADVRVARADTLTPDQQINFANWFAYYRIREHATKAAVTEVISNSSARMGMATLHHHNGVGKRIEDMTNATNKDSLLDDIIQIDSNNGTPLRISLDNVGEYFKVGTNAPGQLNIGSVGSPILSAADGGECQQNFTMLMTDGQWNGSNSATASIADQDKVEEAGFVYPAHIDLVPNTLADIAMKWYKTDLATGLLPKVPIQVGDETLNLDENAQQHMVTFGVAFGPTGTITADPIDRTLPPPTAWPNPTANSVETVDDLRHAAYNGRGQFLSANNPETLISALRNVISDIESRHGSGAAVSFDTASLIAGTSLFFASFDTTGWRGDVRSLSIDKDTGIIDPSSQWEAASLLDSRADVDIVNRTIYTWGKDTVITDNGVLFEWGTVSPLPATAIIDDFKSNQDTSVDITPFTASQTRINYVRGNRTNEGVGLIRKRVSRMGDIVHSSPYFVGKPLSDWPNSGSPFNSYAKKYSSYLVAQRDSPRTPMIYVGANDGMLHGFNANTGEEVFSYVPSTPASTINNEGLHYLTESDYQHQYYVDGSPAAADVYMRTEPAGTLDWRTILVGSLRGGGQGLFALDVTDPSKFLRTQAAAKETVLWEFTDQDDSDLGFTFSDPQITMMNNGKWAVIIGNGYNATGTNFAKLFIIYIEEGIDGQWAVTDYKKIDTGVGSGGNKNGLAMPTLVDLDEDGKTDRIYAGDLHGNMWAFDVSDSDANNWDIAHKDASTNKIPLFTATHHAGSPPASVSVAQQQITMKPLVVKHPGKKTSGTNTPNLMVFFGTGQYVALGDASNTDQQSYYGIWDAGVIPASGPSVTIPQLVEQTFLPGFPISDRVLTSNDVNYILTPSPSELGWFINLPEPGERVVVEAFDFITPKTRLVFFNTMTPSSAPCSAGGASWRMGVEFLTGGNPTVPAFDLNGDRELDVTDKTSDGTDLYFAAGVAFGHGIASASSVITNEDGRSFAITSATDSNNPISDVLPFDDGEETTPPNTYYLRKSWSQLFN